MHRLIRIYFFCTLQLLCFFAWGQNDLQNLYEEIETYDLVKDYAGVLNETKAGELRKLLQQYAKDKTTQIQILCISDLGDKPLSELSLQIANDMGIGDKRLNNGLLILFVVEGKHIRVEPGSGIVQYFPPSVLQPMFEGMRQDMKQGNYAVALEQLSNNLIEELETQFNAPFYYLIDEYILFLLLFALSILLLFACELSNKVSYRVLYLGVYLMAVFIGFYHYPRQGLYIILGLGVPYLGISVYLKNKYDTYRWQKRKAKEEQQVLELVQEIKAVYAKLNAEQSLLWYKDFQSFLEQEKATYEKLSRCKKELRQVKNLQELNRQITDKELWTEVYNFYGPMSSVVKAYQLLLEKEYLQDFYPRTNHKLRLRLLEGEAHKAKLPLYSDYHEQFHLDMEAFTLWLQSIDRNQIKKFYPVSSEQLKNYYDCSSYSIAFDRETAYMQERLEQIETFGLTASESFFTIWKHWDSIRRKSMPVSKSQKKHRNSYKLPKKRKSSGSFYEDDEWLYPRDIGNYDSGSDYGGGSFDGGGSDYSFDD